MTRFIHKKLLNKWKINNCKEIDTQTHTNIYKTINVKLITDNDLVWAIARTYFVTKAVKNERITLEKMKDAIPEDGKIVEVLINILNILQKILESRICLAVTVNVVQYETQLTNGQTMRV